MFRLDLPEWTGTHASVWMLYMQSFNKGKDMGMFNKCLTGIVTAVVCFAAQGVTRLELDSYGGEGPNPYAFGVPWVLFGTQSFTTADGFIDVTRPYFWNPDYANSVNVSFMNSGGDLPGDSRWIDVTFSTDKLGVPLAVGFYPGAQRFPFNQAGHPGLDFSDTGGGFNTLNGQFQIFDIKRDAKGDVTAFAASFEIFGYPAPANAPLIGGRIWYNSDAVMSSVPEANSGLLLAVGMLGMLAVAATSRRSRGLPKLRTAVLPALALLVSSMSVSANATDATEGFISAPGRADIAFDTIHDVLYISGTDQLRRYDMAAGKFLTPIALGGQTLGMDISPDGKTLAVANGQSSGGANRVSLVDLQTGTSSSVNFSLGFYEGGTYSVAFDSQGKLLVSSQFLGSGWTALRKYDPQTHTVSTLGSVTQDAMLSASADRNVIGIAESNISDGRWGYYHTGDASYASQHQWYDPVTGGTSWFNYEIAVSRDGSQFAIPTYGGLYVGDAASVSAKIGQYAGVSPIGAGYSPLADALFLPFAGTNRLGVYDTKTLTEIQSFTVPGTFDWTGNHAFQEGRTKVASDGTYVFTTLDDGVFFADIASSAAVPEPSTYLLGAVGGFSVFAAQRRRKERCASKV